MLSTNTQKLNYSSYLKQKKQNKVNLKREYVTGLTIFATGFAFLAILLIIIIVGQK